MDEPLMGQITWDELFDGWYGRTCQELSPQTAARTSASSLKKRQGSKTKMPLFLDLRGSGLLADASWEMDIQSLGELMMPNTTASLNEDEGYVYLLTSMDTPHQEYYLNCGEKPLTPVPTKLSEILETNADPKYSLSQKACQGILNRAERRGKELPRELKEALIRQSTDSLPMTPTP